MKEVELKDFVSKHGQNGTAKLLKLTQGAVWQMLKSDRQIFVCTNDDGDVSAYEKKPIGKKEAA